MSPDPWTDLAPPPTAVTVSGRRVDAEMPWNFFWARDTAGKCLLILKHSSPAAPEGRLPKLKGIDIELSKYEPGDERALTFRLLDSSHRDIFHRLCADIMASASAVSTEKLAVAATLQRTWRWHYLLRGGSEKRLSEEEQKGLLGELFVIERYLLRQFAGVDAISAWHGPLGAPKDFEINRVCIEAKARRGGAIPFVEINSEHQLDETNLAGLVLSVVVLDRATADSTGQFTISEVAERVRVKVRESDPSAVDLYESRLAAAGFRWEDDYSDSAWSEGTSMLYQVAEDFPRLVAHGIPSGVHRVRYSISLVACEPYAITEAHLVAALKGA